MKKKTLLLLALSVGVLAGCGSGPDNGSNGGGGDGGKITLTFGNPITGGDGTAMRTLVRNFNAEYAGEIEVTETFVSETEFYESLLMTIPMKRAFNVALVHSYRVSAFANRGLLTPLQPIIDGSEVNVDRSQYIPGVFDAMYFNDQLYGIPLDIHTTILYYNKDLLDMYGVAVPTNRAELLTAAKMMPNTDTGGWGLPLSTTWPSEYIYTTALYQNGGVEINENSEPAYNSPAGLTALDMLSSIIHEHKVSPLNVAVDGDLMMFNQGKAMFHINGNWMLASVEENAAAAGFNFGVTSLAKMFTDDPNTEHASKVHSRSHVFVIPDGRLKDDEKQAALTFINYMTENATLWAEAGGHVPANNTARETAEYAELVHQPNYGDVNDFQLNPPSPYWYEAYSPVFSRVTTALSRADANYNDLLAAAVDEGKQLVAEAKSMV